MRSPKISTLYLNSTLLFSFLLISAVLTPSKATVTADFAFSPPGTAPATVSFIDLSVVSGETIVSTFWNFGDGSSITASNPTHTYLYPGVYNVRLVVTGSSGAKDSVVKLLFIQPAAIVTTDIFTSSMGRDFWTGYGHHQFMETGQNSQNLLFHISTGAQAAVVTLTIDSSGSTPAGNWQRVYNIPAYTTIQTANIPKGVTDASNSSTDPAFDARLYSPSPPLLNGSEGLFRKSGIHIQSNADIAVQAQIVGGVTSAITTLTPVNSWGLNYYAINSDQTGSNAGAFSWIFIVANEDNTALQITPKVASRLGKPAGVQFSVNLMKGQIYQLPAFANQDGNGSNHTGTVIRSVAGTDGRYHPIAVFAGSSRTGGESIVCGAGGRDNEIQQLLPTITWGKEYLTAPFSTATGSPVSLSASIFQTSVFKILVTDPSTVVRRNGVALNNIISNSFYQLTSNTADLITADKPIFIAQMMSGSAVCNGGLGDPDIVYPTPLDKAVNYSLFARTTKEAIAANYVTVIVPTAGLASLKIDGSNNFNHSYAHPAKAGYTVIVKGWNAGNASCTIQCDSAFTALSYGLGAAESYLFNPAFKIKSGDTALLKTCAVSGNANLQSNISGTNYHWQVNTGNGFVNINDNSNYSGTNTSSLQLISLPASWYGYQYRCVVDGELSTRYSLKFTNEWTGAVNNSWENAGNWSCGTVPGITTDVSIPAAATVVLTSNVTVRNLTIQPGASFTVSSGYAITITH